MKTFEDSATLSDVSRKHESLTLDSVLETVLAIETLAHQYADEAGFDAETVLKIAMVAREAAVNAILHGNRQDPAKHVRATLNLTAEALTICVADEGDGFNPDAVPDPLTPENILRGSGRGVFLMRAIMDEVHVRLLHPGTEVTLVKRRPQALPG
jgi:serine/threonine-protein kinase RsbW